MSNNLELAQVAAAQNQKEVTINDQAGQLDAGLTDKVSARGPAHDSLLIWLFFAPFRLEPAPVPAQEARTDRAGLSDRPSAPDRTRS
jgi:hypothetical protein